MADNSNAPVMQNQDVIQAARGIRSNPALFAALMSPPTEATPSPDPTAGLATHNDPGGRFGEPPRAAAARAPSILANSPSTAQGRSWGLCRARCLGAPCRTRGGEPWVVGPFEIDRD